MNFIVNGICNDKQTVYKVGSGRQPAWREIFAE